MAEKLGFCLCNLKYSFIRFRENELDESRVGVDVSYRNVYGSGRVVVALGSWHPKGVRVGCLVYPY